MALVAASKISMTKRTALWERLQPQWTGVGLIAAGKPLPDKNFRWRRVPAYGAHPSATTARVDSSRHAPTAKLLPGASPAGWKEALKKAHPVLGCAFDRK